MKKRIEADLISIAHRILKLKNKSEIDILYLETRKLYETLAVLKFYSDNFEQVKNTLSELELTEKLNRSLDETTENKKQNNEEALPNEAIATEKIVAAPEPVSKKELSFEPLFEMTKPSEVEPEKEMIKQISMTDFVGKNLTELDFVKPSKNIKAKEIEKAPVQSTIDLINLEMLSDKKNQLIAIGFNDRIGFEQQLFEGSSADFNRVLSQLNTFKTFEEANKFIIEMVKPDYNHWVDKTDFEERFLEIIKNKFN